MAITKITNSMVSVNAIQGTLIADNAITAVHIASNAVASIQIAENNVTARELAANTITVAQLADDCVEADKIADGVITTNHLNKTMVSSQTEVTPVAGDFVLLGDTSDSNNLKKAPLTLLLNSNVDLSTKLNLSGGTMTGDIAHAGNFTLDVEGVIKLDANGAEIQIKDGGTEIGAINMASSNLNIDAKVADKDIVFRGIDGSSDVTALTLDMSSAGRAVFNAGGTFNDHVYFGDNDKIILGGGDDLQIYHDASDSYIKDHGTGNLLIQFSDLYLSKDAGSSHMARFHNSGHVSLAGTANASGDGLSNLTVGGGSGDCGISVYSGSSNVSRFMFADGTSGGAQYDGFMAYEHNNQKMGFGVAGSGGYAMQIDSSGRMGINRVPAISNSKLEVGGADNVPLINVEASGVTGGLGIGSSGLQFFHGTTKRMQIISDGEIVQGTASLADTYSPLVNGFTGDALVVGRHANSGSLGLWRTNTMEFKYYHNGGGYIMTFGSNSVISGDFNDTSDVNLKENISSISDGTTVIKALRPVKFDWKASGKGNNQHGFIAQEVETVLPDAVDGNNYVENETGLPEDEPAGNGKTMNSNAVLAHAVKAIQELEARIKTLEG